MASPGREATQRGIQALEAVLRDGPHPAVVVAHGNLTSLLLHHIDARPGFETWSSLTDPDVFRIEATSAARWSAERIWNEFGADEFGADE